MATRCPVPDTGPHTHPIHPTHTTGQTHRKPGRHLDSSQIADTDLPTSRVSHVGPTLQITTGIQTHAQDRR